MISANLRFEGFDSESWTKIVGLFSPGLIRRLQAEPSETDAPEFRAPEDVRAGTLVIIVDSNDHVLKATHSIAGRVKDVDYRGTESLPELTKCHGVLRTLVVQEGTLEEAMERLALRLRRGEDYVSQVLVLSRILRELGEAGRIRIWPAPLKNVPIPSPPMVRRALDVVLPSESAAIVVLWERGNPWTSIAVRRTAGAIDWVAGPDVISRWTGPLGGDWRRDHRVIVDAVAQHMAPVHVGLFSEATTIRRLLSHPEPGHWAAAAAVRDVAFYPSPPYVSVAIGADVVRGVADQTTKLVGGLQFFEALGPLTGSLRNRITETASVTATLGFNPLRILADIIAGSSDANDSD